MTLREGIGTQPGRRRTRGQALAEFAIVAPVLLLFILGIVDFGRAIYAYNTVANAARMGTRTAIVNQNTADIAGRAAAQATSLGIDAASPCTSSNGVCVAFQDSTGTGTPPCMSLFGPDRKSCVAVVTVKYTFSAITPVIGTLIGPIPLASTSIQALESTCTGAGLCPIP